MKTLIIANNTIVFGKELQNELLQKNYEVSLLDFETLMLSANGKEDNRFQKAFAPYKKISKLHMFFRIYFIQKILKQYHFDCVNIHYSRWIYLLILPTLKQMSYIITFYGSDFYRSTPFIKRLQTPLYQNAKALTFTNPLTKEAFVNHYHDFDTKSHVCRFGLKTLDYIDKNRSRSKVEIKNHLGYATDKITVTCGYNSTFGQQHFKMITALETLEPTILEQLQFIFPLTYGNASHKERVKQRLQKSSLNYLTLEEFLYTDDNAAIKLASDIMINVLETDSFSGSMQEFLYADNLVITGSWLPYELFDREGISYLKIDQIDDLPKTLTDAIAQYHTKRAQLQTNREIIYKLSSWTNNITSWSDTYENC